MSARSFLDTNILVYTDDRRSPEKRDRAIEISTRCRANRSGVVSSQVLQEYFATTTKKLKLSVEVAKQRTLFFARFKVVQIKVEDILAAIDIHRIHQIAFWDGLIVRAALRSGCSVLYSEDLQAGRRIDGLEIVNPFL